MSEVLRILRDITGSTHLQLDTPNRTLTMRDSPQTVALTGRLIQQIEQLMEEREAIRVKVQAMLEAVAAADPEIAEAIRG